MGRHERSYSDNDGGGWAPYVPVAQRRQQAERKAAALKKKGQVLQPVLIQGRTLARSFWGKAWCNKLEAYSDYANRLPRGRTYVCNGSVIDLQVGTGEVQALVSGSDVYRVRVHVQPLPAPLWSALLKQCSGKVDSLIELLQGRLSKAVMEVMTRPGQGLFPLPREISFDCSCPDSARLCKHVAATLYGVGARLDDAPELLFRLRHVDPGQLFQHLGGATVVATGTPGAKDRLQGADLSALFGIELSEDAAPDPVPPGKAAKATKAAKAAKATQSARTAKAARALKAPPARTAKQAAAPAPAPAPATPRKLPRAKLVSAAELIERGIPRHKIQAWLAAGVLLGTEQRGRYQSTPQTAAHIKAYQAQQAKRQWGF